MYEHMYTIRSQKFRLAIGRRRGRQRTYCLLFYCFIVPRARRPSAPDLKSHHFGAAPGTFLRPLAPQGSIFMDFSTTQRDIKKHLFFDRAQNR